MGILKDIGSIMVIISMILIYGLIVNPKQTGEMLKGTLNGLQKTINDFKKWIDNI